MALVYATTTDLDAWMAPDVAPTNAEKLLRSASHLVRRATRTWLYDVDAAGKPTDTEILAAFRDATTAQAAAWASLGIDPGPGTAAVASASTSSSIGSATVQRDTRDGQDQDRVDTVTALVPEAQAELDSVAHLVGTGVWTW